MAKQNGNGKLKAGDFTINAIKKLRDPNKSKGIHSVYSGFNAAFREYFGKDADPVQATTKLATEGKIAVGFARGGAMLYLPGEAPVKKDGGAAALAKILG